MDMIKKIILKLPGIKSSLTYRQVLKAKPAFWKKFLLLRGFLKDRKRYEKLNINSRFNLSSKNIKPCIYDKTVSTPLDPTYFYQDTWCVKKIFENKPLRHYDIGSQAEMVGIVSQFTSTIMVDIRPVELKLPGLSFVKGNILDLPFEDNALGSISSICVIEHIGLGRYGDALDPFGSEKAIRELIRVLAPKGNLYISLPVDIENTIYFNAHRAFTREYVLELFQSIKLISEKYIYKYDLVDTYDKTRGFGTGLFHFSKQ